MQPAVPAQPGQTQGAPQPAGYQYPEWLGQPAVDALESRTNMTSGETLQNTIKKLRQSYEADTNTSWPIAGRPMSQATEGGAFVGGERFSEGKMTGSPNEMIDSLMGAGLKKEDAIALAGDTYMTPTKGERSFTPGYGEQFNPQTKERYVVGSREDPAMQEKLAKAEYSAGFKAMADRGGLNDLAKANMDSWNTTVAGRKQAREDAKLSAALEKERSREDGGDPVRLAEIEDRQSQIGYERKIDGLKKAIFMQPGSTSEKNKALNSLSKDVASTYKQDKERRLERYQIQERMKSAEQTLNAAKDLARFEGNKEAFEFAQKAEKNMVDVKKDQAALDEKLINETWGGSAKSQDAKNAMNFLKYSKEIEDLSGSPAETAKIWDWFSGLDKGKRISVLGNIINGEHADMRSAWETVYKQLNA